MWHTACAPSSKSLTFNPISRCPAAEACSRRKWPQVTWSAAHTDSSLVRVGVGVGVGVRVVRVRVRVMARVSCYLPPGPYG